MGLFRKYEHIQTKKNDNKNVYISLAIGLFGTLLVVVGGSYAYLTDQVVATNSNKISAGTITVDFNSESTAITMQKAIPQQDANAIASNTPYTFKVRNTGTLPVNYKLKLKNVCTTGTTINGGTTIDKCIPLSKIKVAIKYGSGAYETKTITFTDNTTAEMDLTTAKTLNATNTSEEYSIKIWLNENAGNEYSSIYEGCTKTAGCNVSFAAQIEIYGEQITT